MAGQRPDPRVDAVAAASRLKTSTGVIADVLKKADSSASAAEEIVERERRSLLSTTRSFADVLQGAELELLDRKVAALLEEMRHLEPYVLRRAALAAEELAEALDDLEDMLRSQLEEALARCEGGRSWRS